MYPIARTAPLPEQPRPAKPLPRKEQHSAVASVYPCLPPALDGPRIQSHSEEIGRYQARWTARKLILFALEYPDEVAGGLLQELIRQNLPPLDTLNELSRIVVMLEEGNQ